MHVLKVVQPPKKHISRRVLSLTDFEAQGKKTLPQALFHYVSGASEDEVTYSRNRDAFRQRAFFPNVLVDVTQRTASTKLFGVTYNQPFGIAPMGFSRLIAPDGDVVLARAASQAGIPFILSGASLTKMEDVQAAATSSWFQAYCPGDSRRIEALLERVEAAGYKTLVITVDTALNGSHERAARHGFVAPIRMGDLNLTWQAMTHPAWAFKVMLRNRFAGLGFRFENMDAAPGPRVLSASLIRDIGPRDALSWQHIDFVRKLWKGNLVIKGIMTPSDAVCANSAGVDGIIVSNHGGRQADCAASSLEALERISEANIGLQIMYDGGIRRGSDVLKALKAGAAFAFVGRPMLFAAAVAGVAGVTHAIELLSREINLNMALLGIAAPCDVKSVSSTKS